MCASIVGLTILASSLDSCTPLKYVSGEINKGAVKFSANNFIENSKLVIIRNNTLEYDIAVVKGSDNSYRALELKCTHQDNALVANATGFQCNLHGSTFALDGTVVTSPATSSLKEYRVSAVGDLIEVFVK